MNNKLNAKERAHHARVKELACSVCDLQTLIEAFGAEREVKFTAPEYIDPETGEVYEA